MFQPDNGIHLTEVKATLLATLYSRALESRSQHPILVDPWAETLISRIDYDFHKTGIDRNDAVAVAIRAKQLDEWTAQFLTHNPSATVLHLGCGLDSRPYRIDAKPSVVWYDIDYPDVIELRARLLPARSGCRLMGTSVTDPAWLKTISAGACVMVIAEGLFYYLEREDVHRLIRGLTDHFASGFIAFDAMNNLGLQLMNLHPAILSTRASLRWALEDSRQIENYSPKLRCIRAVSTLASPHVRKMDFTKRWLCEIYRRVPQVSRISQSILCKFNHAAVENLTDTSGRAETIGDG